MASLVFSSDCRRCGPLEAVPWEMPHRSSAEATQGKVAYDAIPLVVGDTRRAFLPSPRERVPSVPFARRNGSAAAAEGFLGSSASPPSPLLPFVSPPVKTRRKESVKSPHVTRM